VHDYYRIWFYFTANFFISEETVWVKKLNSHYFISASRNVNNFYKIVDIFQTFLILFFNKKMGNNVAQFFSWVCNFTPILISLFWQLTGRAHWAWKEGVWGGWVVVLAISEKWGNYLPYPPTIAARLLGNGGKIEPYTTIIIMVDRAVLANNSSGFDENRIGLLYWLTKKTAKISMDP
jgi:hypothetical protein